MILDPHSSCSDFRLLCAWRGSKRHVSTFFFWKVENFDPLGSSNYRSSRSGLIMYNNYMHL